MVFFFFFNSLSNLGGSRHVELWEMAGHFFEFRVVEHHLGKFKEISVLTFFFSITLETIYLLNLLPQKSLIVCMPELIYQINKHIPLFNPKFIRKRPLRKGMSQ